MFRHIFTILIQFILAYLIQEQQKARCGGACHPQSQPPLGGWGTRNTDSESVWATLWDPVSKTGEGTEVKIPVRFNNCEITYVEPSSTHSSQLQSLSVLEYMASASPCNTTTKGQKFICSPWPAENTPVLPSALGASPLAHSVLRASECVCKPVFPQTNLRPT